MTLGVSFNQFYLGFAVLGIVILQWEDMAEGRKAVTWWRVIWALLGNAVALSWAVECWPRLA